MPEQMLYVAVTPFEAARSSAVRGEPRAARLHGHSFVASVCAELPAGWAQFPGAETSSLCNVLRRCVHPLDYGFLNEHIDTPTDANVARWIRARLDAPGVGCVGVRSTRRRGAVVDGDGSTRIWKSFVFESAHRLPNVPVGHKCGRMHGHGFEALVCVRADSGSDAAESEFVRLDRVWAPIHADLHHNCLNDIPGLENPTSELIGRYLWQRLQPELNALSSVSVHETANCGGYFDGRHFRIWKEVALESALALKRAPAADPRRRLHGHRFRLRLQLTAPLDEVLGWTVDFGDVKSCFDPIFLQLDHQPLCELAGAEDNDLETLLHWIKERAARAIPALERIDLYETQGCGAILAWGDDRCASPIRVHDV